MALPLASVLGGSGISPSSSATSAANSTFGGGSFGGIAPVTVGGFKSDGGFGGANIPTLIAYAAVGVAALWALSKVLSR